MSIEPLWEMYFPHSEIGHRILYYPVVPSAQDTAWTLVQAGVSHGHAIMAGTQSRGRGRAGRVWLDGSQQSSLLISIIVRPTAYLAARLSMLASMAMLRCVRRITGIDATLKWPNDLLYDSRKLSGILVETQSNTDGDIACVIGLGLNLNFDDASHPSITGTTASIEEMSRTKLTPVQAAMILLEELQRIYASAHLSDDDLVEWASRVASVGDSIEIRDGSRTIRGIVAGVQPNGCLSLHLPNGEVREFLTGEVLSQDPA